MAIVTAVAIVLATLAGLGLFAELAAWPAKGGGQPGTGDGFNLVKATVHDALDGGILIATARSPACALVLRSDRRCSLTHDPRLLRRP